MKSNRLLRRGPALALLVAGTLAASILRVQAQAKGTVENFTATAVNVTGAPDPVKIDLLRWSTDAEREQVFNALSEKGEKEFLNVLAKQPTLGYIWTSESAGYSVRYAYQTVAPDGGERVIVATDKPLGSWNPQIWKATATATANGYEFTVIELRLNRRRGTGEGKSSLLAKVTADKTAKTITLENYPGATVVLKDVKALQKAGAAAAQTGKPPGR
jgi:hypothetical protein